MDELIKLALGDQVQRTDGPLGLTIAVLLRPREWVVTELVVEPRHRIGMGRYIPFKQIDALPAPCVWTRVLHALGLCLLGRILQPRYVQLSRALRLRLSVQVRGLGRGSGQMLNQVPVRRQPFGSMGSTIRHGTREPMVSRLECVGWGQTTSPRRASDSTFPRAWWLPTANPSGALTGTSAA